MRAPVRVVSADEAAARDAAAIAAGVPSRALMQRAGSAAAAEMSRRFRRRLRRGVAVFAGSGNNGGDAWVVAGVLAAAGAAVRVWQSGEPRSADAFAERAHALPLVAAGEPRGDEMLVVDGLLGTGSSGGPRGAIADAVARIAEMRARGARVVALDVPSGVDATTGAAAGAVAADLTVTFGSLKRGLLVARATAGRIAVLDIGLGLHAELRDGAPTLVDAPFVAERVPPIAADAHKGTRRRLVIVGGGAGMVGAAILAARAAVRSGIGVVRLLVAPESVAAAQTAAYEALARAWPESDDALRESLTDWADGLVIGPGLGNSAATRALAERVLSAWRGPVVADADALNVFAGDAEALGRLLSGRPALVTPHVSELARLSGMSPQAVLDGRFDVGVDLARRLGACVLLKGVPTVITTPFGERFVSATGTPVLAGGGSGDLLSGIAGTLLAQTRDAAASAACAAWVHGRAGELAGANRGVRGVTLDDVRDAIPRAWRAESGAIARYPVLATLPAVGGRV